MLWTVVVQLTAGIKTETGVGPFMPTADADRPSWVVGALAGGGVELVPLTQVKDDLEETEPIWTPHYHDGWDEELRSWEGDVSKAGFTCENCEWPYRPVVTTDSSEIVFRGKEQKPSKKKVWVYTKRCNSCESAIKRWQDGRKMAERVVLVATTDPRAARVAFVTLSTRNYSATLSEAEATRLFKREVTAWRRSAGVKEHVIGGIDYFECTTNPEDGTRNAHMHGVWCMASYWKQSEMLESWGRGGVRISECKNPKKAAYYCTGYGGKSPVEGVRCKETWGACRGKEFESVRTAHENSQLNAIPVSSSVRPA